MILVVYLLFVLLLVVVPWLIRTGTGTSKTRLTVVRVMRAVSITILLVVGIPAIIVGISWINGSWSIDTWDEAGMSLFMGVVAISVGSISCLLAGLALWAWSRKVAHDVADSTFERQGTDVYCKKCGFELIGPGGPCRKCDDVKTTPCASCGRYILAKDKTCPYCGANSK